MISWVYSRYKNLCAPGMVTHTCKPSTHKFEDSLDYKPKLVSKNQGLVVQLSGITLVLHV
jgi:hypothetical protein